MNAERAKRIEIWEFNLSMEYTRNRYASLAKYNSERARGILHNPDWMALMAKEQERFNEENHPTEAVS